MTDRENKFLAALEITPGPYLTKKPIDGQRFGNEIYFIYPNCRQITDLISQAPEMFLALFHTAFREQDFCEDESDLEHLDVMIRPLESATKKTWKQICEIWEGTK